MLLRAYEQLGIDLLVKAKGEFGRADVIDRNDNCAAEGAPQKDSNPLGGTRRPEQNAVALGDGARFQFTSKTEGNSGWRVPAMEHAALV